MELTLTGLETSKNIFQWCREYKMPLSIFYLRIIDGKKIPITYKNDVNYPVKDITWNLYNKAECKLVNNYILETKKTWNCLNIYPDQIGYIILDFDSQEELSNAIKRGFPKNAFHTLSTRKRLPHYIVDFKDNMIKPWRGHDQKIKRELDILTGNAFELADNQVFGEHLIQLTKKDLSKYLGIDMDLLINDPEDYPTKRENYLKGNLKPKKNKIKKKKVFGEIGEIGEIGVESPNTQVLFCNRTISGRNFIYGTELSGIFNKNKGMEILPFTELEKIVLGLDVDKVDSYSQWYNIVVAVANSVKTGEDPYKYISLINTFYQGSLKCEEKWIKENEMVFSKVYLKADSREPHTKLSVKYLLNLLYSQNKKLWVTCAFTAHRIIEPAEFKRLTLNDALTAFNNNHSIIKGIQGTQIVSYCPIIKEYRFYTEEGIKKNYRNLKYFNPDSKNDIKYNKFIDKWLDWEYRKTFENEGFFPKLVTPYKYFNTFTGFEVERVEDYNEVVAGLSKEQLEQELEFILQHHKYIIGSENTEEVYNYLLKYMAHAIKYPSVLPRVSWCIYSKQGAGKNQLLNLYANMLGSEYYATTQKGEQLFGSFNALLNNKIIVNLNEVRNIIQYAEDIKVVIADEMIQTTRKFRDSQQYRNYTRLFQFANSSTHFWIEADDRRQLLVQSEIKQKYIEGYTEKLASQVKSLYIHKCLYRYLTEFVEVSKYYNFEKNRPLTKEYHAVRSRNIPYLHRYIEYLYELGIKKEYTLNKLWVLFEDFLLERKEKISIRYDKFTGDIRKLIYDTGSNLELEDSEKIFYIIGRPKKDKNYYYIDKKRLKEFMLEYKYDWQESYGFLD